MSEHTQRIVINYLASGSFEGEPVDVKSFDNPTEALDFARSLRYRPGITEVEVLEQEIELSPEVNGYSTGTVISESKLVVPKDRDYRFDGSRCPTFSDGTPTSVYDDHNWPAAQRALAKQLAASNWEARW